MSKFKVGDSVTLCGRPEQIRTIINVPLRYSDESWATHPDKIWLDGSVWTYASSVGGHYPVDDELPPAPESVVYREEDSPLNTDAELLVCSSMYGGLLIQLKAVDTRDGTYANAGMRIDADSALQLSHDLLRMAMTLKRKEKADEETV